MKPLPRVKFPTNIPVCLSLVDVDPISLEESYGRDVYLYPTTTGEGIYANHILAVKLNMLDLVPGQRFSVTKRWNGKHGHPIRWDVALLNGNESSREGEPRMTTCIGSTRANPSLQAFPQQRSPVAGSPTGDTRTRPEPGLPPRGTMAASKGSVVAESMPSAPAGAIDHDAATEGAGASVGSSSAPPPDSLEEQLRRSLEQAQFSKGGDATRDPNLNRGRREEGATGSIRRRGPHSRQEGGQSGQMAFGWVEDLKAETEALTDVLAAATAYSAEKHGGTISKEDVRSLAITAYISSRGRHHVA